MPTHLVTGGAGFIGSHLAASLIERGDDVVVLDNLDGGKTENVPAGATLVVGSVADQAAVTELFASYRFDGVYHLAAFAAEGISHAVKHHNYSVNLLGSINLINASLAAKVQFFGFASSVAVYGHGHVPMREDEQPTPADSYGNAKLAVERELAVTMHLQGLPYFAMRMHNVYGERQNMGDPYRNAVAIFLNQIMRGEPISVYGDGSQIRAFTYAPDIVGTFLAAADQPSAWGQVFNVGSSQTTTVLEMAHAVRTAMGVPDHPIIHLAARDEVHAAYTDNTLARTMLGDWADTPLTQGLRHTAGWAREHGPVEPTTSLTIENDAADKPEWLTWASGRAVTS
ncbi:NAD-dependent epimerase/dehydratase family protein [Streptomyces sp. CB03238]|uniref:NAD-dependent epimerase/dehydratase family protein n=1 Tax=Streptomyces sp. CB03238 TaxID=1907777 RepID=UPI000A101E68|nr:NAD-dependent epimerase/dehydratase family protein [Streptomyces sp. CB03238]ORT59195.1 NarL family transcriptional regulator [Streptomyces sp. CB03238]